MVFRMSFRFGLNIEEKDDEFDWEYVKEHRIALK